MIYRDRISRFCNLDRLQICGNGYVCAKIALRRILSLPRSIRRADCQYYPALVTARLSSARFAEHAEGESSPESTLSKYALVILRDNIAHRRSSRDINNCINTHVMFTFTIDKNPKLFMRGLTFSLRILFKIYIVCLHTHTYTQVYYCYM